LKQGGGKRGVMTQSLYAHMNNGNKINEKKFSGISGIQQRQY
jgi:hypothetical protein